MSEKDRDDGRLVTAYNRMLEQVRHAGEVAEKEVRPALAHLLETAKDKAVELGELTREEAEKVAAWIRRDVGDAADYLRHSEAGELVDWLKFDIRLVEERLLELFTSVADQTRLELIRLKQAAERSTEYHTGEVTGIGALACVGCGKVLHFHATGHIPPCPKCHGTRFVRAGADE
jgi:hypothetical protein